MLQREGWAVNHKRIERIWREQGLKSGEVTKEKAQVVVK